MNLYLKIKSLLEQDKIYRNSYKELRWKIHEDEGSVVNGYMTKTQYLNATDDETIRRTAQKCVEAHPELDASGVVKVKRVEQENMGGNHVFNSAKKVRDEEFIKDAMSVLEMKWKNKTAAEKVGEEYEHDKAQWKRYNQMLKDVTPKVEPKEDDLTRFALNLFNKTYTWHHVDTMIILNN